MSAIVSRIADFLKEHVPFSNLSFDELTKIAAEIRVMNLEKDKTLFSVNDKLHDSFYVVASGIINLSAVSDIEETLVIKCVEGEIFGLRPFFAKNNYLMTAKAREDTIVYAIPITTFKPHLLQNTEIATYLLESFASFNNSSLDSNGKIVSDTVAFSNSNSETQYFQSLSYSKSPLMATTKNLVKETAQLMTDNNVDSVIVIEDKRPVGIITDSDIRSKIATGRFSRNVSLDKIMSSPVIAVTENVSLAEAQLLLLQYSVSHLCVTVDGTDKSEVKGVITEHDLVVAQANNPGVLIKEIKRSEDAKDLRKVRLKLEELVQSSLDKNIPLSHIMNVTGEINAVILKRAIEIASIELGAAPARFAWFSLGSQGRKEQLLLTDQDSMLVFEDVAEAKYRDVKDYFVKLAKKAVSILEKVGYPTCSNGNVASNLSWCKSLTEWSNQFNTWMNTPGENSDKIYGIFFDYELVIGESKIEEALSNLILKNTEKNTLFFDFLGNDALRKPAPLGFFKKFNLEEEGIYKDKFDIKNRAILPLVDAARLFILSNQVKGINNTYLRFKQLAISDATNSEIYHSCAEAFLTLNKIRTVEGLKNDNDGQYITIQNLSKMDKEKLKNALNPMKELEELIKDSFQLTQFS